MRLHYTGSAAHWGFAVYRASHDDYDKSVLPTGLPFGTPQEALDCACGLYLGDATAWLDPPSPTNLQAGPLVAFTLPGTPYSVQMARFYVRAALGYHDLGEYAENVETVTSELVSNAITHASAQAFDLELLRLEDSGAIVVVVTDPCPLPPVKRDPAAAAEHGRGLLVVEALSTRWGWNPSSPGKAVFAIFTRES